MLLMPILTFILQSVLGMHGYLARTLTLENPMEPENEEEGEIWGSSSHEYGCFVSQPIPIFYVN
jgi:hypothetical protein